MSVTDYILGIFSLDTEEEARNGLEQLHDILVERQAELKLSAEYSRPHPNMTDEPTVVFPYTLYTGEGEEYGAGSKEFIVPDNGLNDSESPLVQFVAVQHGIAPSEVDFSALANVEDLSDDATLKDNGDVEVGA